MIKRLYQKGYIVVEGPLGVGKTSLARLLAGRINGKVILEDTGYRNPFLVINASDIDFVNVPSDLDDLILEIERMERGTKYYVPLGSRH